MGEIGWRQIILQEEDFWAEIVKNSRLLYRLCH